MKQRLTAGLVLWMRQQRVQGASYRELSRATHIAPGVVWSACNGLTHKRVPMPEGMPVYVPRVARVLVVPTELLRKANEAR